MVSCQVIGAKEPLDHTAGLLKEFATSVCNDGLADPTSEPAWLLLKTSIVCGLELFSLCDEQKPRGSQTSIISLHILQAAVEAWQAQLWQKCWFVVHVQAAGTTMTNMFSNM